jgi:hypothetical protein
MDAVQEIVDKMATADPGWGSSDPPASRPYLAFTIPLTESVPAATLKW